MYSLVEGHQWPSAFQKLAPFHLHDNSSFCRGLVIVWATGNLDEAEFTVELLGGQIGFADLEEAHGLPGKFMIQQGRSDSEAAEPGGHGQVEDLPFGWGGGIAGKEIAND